GHGHGETILVVDDEALIRETVKHSLAVGNYRYLSSEDGEAAADRLRRHADKIRVVLTDLFMPESDGYALIARVNHQYPDISVIVMSSQLDETQRQRLDALEVDAVLNKPFSSEELLAALDEIVSRH
ncbi:MAG: response regulator, partial [Opitutales bacterium]